MNFSSKTLLSSLVAIALISACNTSSTEEKSSATEVSATQTQTHFPAFSPIHLNYGETKIDLNDYFPNITGISSILLGSQGALEMQSNGVLTIQDLELPLDVLSIEYQNETYDLVVFASKKKLHTLNYSGDEATEEVLLMGSMNGWNGKANPLRKGEDGKWSVDLILNPGLYEYLLIVDGEQGLDPNNPDKKSNGQGGFNSTFLVGNAQNFSAPFLSSNAPEGGRIQLEASEQSTFYVFLDNQLLAKSEQDVSAFSFEVPQNENNHRAHIRAWAVSENGISNDVLIPLDKGTPITNPSQLTREDHENMIMYFIMVDRFNNGNTNNDAPVQNDSILPLANHLGGDLAGIDQKIKDGYFADLGVNTLWISPITQNPLGAWGLWDKGVSSKFSGYHGYWPKTSTTIDHRFGSDQEFRSLIDNTHDANMNILVDYVANHVHQEHSIYQKHPEWATSLYLEDGRMNTELWDEERLTTWFDTFLPTLDFSKEEVREAMTDSALYWFENYPIDGFRHDATKHIQEEFWRLLTKKLKERVVYPENRSIYQIGETYGNPELIRSYVSSGMLDAQFDFNLYDAMVDAFAKDESDFDNLARVLNQSMEYYGAHHKMGNITGNQDRTRFVSYADGAVSFSEDPKLAGWTRDIEHQGKEGYEKMQLLNAFLMSAPGIPCIYYGDEIAMPGANDPDNRRMMRFENWNEDETETRDQLKALIALRKNRMSLLYGDLQILHNTGGVLVIERSYLGEHTRIIINKNNSLTPLPEKFQGEMKDDQVLYQTGLVKSGGISSLESRSFVYLNLE